MEHDIDFAVASTDVSFSGRAIQLCQKRATSLPPIPFIRAAGALCDDMIPILKSSEQACASQFMHDIFQEVLDADAEASEEDSHLAAVASYVRTKILSRGEWHAYEHIRGSFTSKSIKDGDFEKYVLAASTQNRPDEMKDLVADVRFATLGMVANPLHVAARSVNLQTINILLSSDIDFKSYIKSKGILSPLHEFTTDAHLPALRSILDAGFDHLEMTSKPRLSGSGPNSGSTIWHLAAAKNAVDILEALLESEGRLEALRTLSSEGRTPIGEAIAEGQADAALLLLNECPNGELAYFQAGSTLLQLAARLGSDTLYQSLLENGVTAGLDPPDGSTPLHYISWRIELSLLRRLLSMHEIGQKRSDGRPAVELFLLHLKSEITSNYRHHRNGPVEQKVFDTLFGKTSVRVEAGENDTPIWEFCCRSIIEPRGLVAKGVKSRLLGEWVIVPTIRAMTAGASNALSDYVACRHQSAAIPIFQALVKLHPDDFRETWVYEAVEIVLEASGDPASYRNAPDAIKLLNAAVMYGHMRVIRSLVGKGWDAFWRGGSSCALEVACEFSPPEVLALLVSSANRHRLNEIATISGLSLVERILAGPARDVPPKFKYLLTEGLDPNKATTGDSRYPFVVAVADEGRFDIVTLLEEYGADILAQGPDGMDVAKAAAFYGNLGMLQRIHVAASETPNVFDWNLRHGPLAKRHGSGPDVEWRARHILHYAAEGGQAEVLRFLLDNGIVPSDEDGGINVLDGEGLTPRELAFRDDHHAAYSLLVRRGAKLLSEVVPKAS
ncbi:hypothetical protein PG996_008540 [Apiospora saccharicola]|uniref:Ankyrin n=1 Tax=Apiospora saccharicola TaxID=335842 RepID=A0ABR1V1H7_9PEZI